MLDIEKQYKGSKFKEFIEHHLRDGAQASFHAGAISKIIKELPENLGSLMSSWIKFYMDNKTPFTDKNFWDRDTSEVFSEITSEAKSFLNKEELFDYRGEEDVLFDMFTVIAKHMAEAMESTPAIRQFAGIRTKKDKPGTISKIIGISFVILYHLFFIVSPYLIIREWGYKTAVLYAVVVVKYINDITINRFWFIQTLSLSVLFGAIAWFCAPDFYFVPSLYYIAITIFDSVSCKKLFHRATNDFIEKHKMLFEIYLFLFMSGCIALILFK